MASPKKKHKRRQPNRKLPEKIREQLTDRAADLPRVSNFSGLKTKSYLARIASCLELDYPEDPLLKNRYWYDSLQEQFSELGQLNFVNNWFTSLQSETASRWSESNKTPELGKAYEEVNLDNLYHLALLCSYTEQYGVPQSKWFKQACIDRANDSLYNLSEGNLLFYKILTRCSYAGWGEEITNRVDTRIKYTKIKQGSFKMSKIQNAAHVCGGVHNRDYQMFNELKHQVLEQALLVKVPDKSYNFASPKIKKVFRYLVSEEEIILSRYKSRLDIWLPLWKKLVKYI
jgi:hypothetical protein